GVMFASIAAPAWSRRTKLRSNTLSRVGYLFAMWGFILGAFGQAIETLSARIEFPDSGWLHDASSMMTGGVIGIIAVGLLGQMAGKRWRRG
ncbi:MAG: hypothetical protein ABIO65_09220, partial [Nitrospiria bacterium]